MAQHTDNAKAPGRVGRILHSTARYDLLVWLATRGRVQAFRQRMLRFAALRRGEEVLDAGCGTGSLAIAAKRQVGRNGVVYGLDASSEMIAGAKRKARRAGVAVEFYTGLAQSLPFPDARFDVVLTTLMLHHLTCNARREFANEICRVLKPGGRVLAIDFEKPERVIRGPLDLFHRRHGHIALREFAAVLSDVGMRITADGHVGMRDMHFVLAQAPRHAVQKPLQPLDEGHGEDMALGGCVS